MPGASVKANQNRARGGGIVLTPSPLAILIGVVAPVMLRSRVATPSPVAIPISVAAPAFAGLTTRTCLDADWGTDVRNDGVSGHLDGNDFAGVDGSGAAWRWAQKFDVSGIDGTILKVELVVNVVDVPGSPSTWDVGPYGSNGQDDPEADIISSGATTYSRCGNTGQYVNDTTTFATGGLRTLDLGPTAVSHLQAALSLGRFSVSCRYVNEVTPTNGSAIEEYSGGSNPPELCVTFAPDNDITLTPTPVTVPLVTADPTMVRVRRVTPSPVTIPLALPTPAIARLKTLSPSPAVIPILTAAPVMQRTRVVTPSPAPVPLVIPTPTVGTTGGAAPTTLTPTPVTIPLAVPTPALLRQKLLTPGAVPVPIVVPAATLLRSLALLPGPVAVQIVAPAPTLVRLRTLLPGAVVIPLAVPAPTVTHPKTLTPAPAPVILLIPAPTLSGGTGGGTAILDPITYHGIVPWPRS